MTLEDLVSTFDSFPGIDMEKIIANREAFAVTLAKLLEIQESDPNHILYPVGRGKPLPERFEPQDLVDLDNRGLLLNKSGMKIREPALAALEEMIAAAASEGLSIMVSSAYRSYEYQKNLFSYYTGIYGEAETEKFSARAGTSQHQLGTAIDFGSITDDFKDTEEGKWIRANGWKYGFSLSYPEGYENVTGYKYEPWHFRYITKEGAAAEREFFSGLQFLLLSYLDSNTDFFSQRLETR